jgi:hypothetical protein
MTKIPSLINDFQSNQLDVLCIQDARTVKLLAQDILKKHHISILPPPSGNSFNTDTLFLVSNWVLNLDPQVLTPHPQCSIIKLLPINTQILNLYRRHTLPNQELIDVVTPFLEEDLDWVVCGDFNQVSDPLTDTLSGKHDESNSLLMHLLESGGGVDYLRELQSEQHIFTRYSSGNQSHTAARLDYIIGSLSNIVHAQTSTTMTNSDHLLIHATVKLSDSISNTKWIKNSWQAEWAPIIDSYADNNPETTIHSLADAENWLSELGSITASLVEGRAILIRKKHQSNLKSYEESTLLLMKRLLIKFDNLTIEQRQKHLQWAGRAAQHIDGRSLFAKDQIKELVHSLQQQLKSSLKKDLKELIEKERTRQQQLKQGDPYLKFKKFKHANSSGGTIKYLIHNGAWVYEGERILELTHKHWQDTFSPKTPPSRVNLSKMPQLPSAHSINEPITLHDLQALIQNMPKTAAGPDHLGHKYLTQASTSFVQCLLKIINICLSAGNIPQSWRSSVTVPIPKTEHANTINQYRPISLLNNMYKLLSSVLNHRLQNLVSQYQLIPKTQIGFKHLHECCEHSTHAFNIAHNLERNKQDGWFLFIDFEKAYDSIHHSAIRETLEHINLDSLSVQLIMNLVGPSTTRIMTAWGLTEEVRIDRGVRQGDVISPLLFNLCLSPLLFLLEPGESPWDPYLAFADDILLMALCIALLLINWYTITKEGPPIGLSTNLSKCALMGPEHPLFQNFPPNIIKNPSHYKYLGCPFSFPYSYTTTHNFILAIAEKTIAQLRKVAFLVPVEDLATLANVTLGGKIRFISRTLMLRKNTTDAIHQKVTKLLQFRMKGRKIGVRAAQTFLQTIDYFTTSSQAYSAAICNKLLNTSNPGYPWEFLNQFISKDSPARPPINQILAPINVQILQPRALFQFPTTQVTLALTIPTTLLQSTIPEIINLDFITTPRNENPALIHWVQQNSEALNTLVPKPIINSIPEINAPIIFTDGSFSESGAAAIFIPPATFLKVSSPLIQNNVDSEVLGLLTALQVSSTQETIILVDCMPAMQLLSKSLSPTSYRADWIIQSQNILKNKKSKEIATQILHVNSHLLDGKKNATEQAKQWEDMWRKYGEHTLQLLEGNQIADRIASSAHIPANPIPANLDNILTLQGSPSEWKAVNTRLASMISTPQNPTQRTKYEAATLNLTLTAKLPPYLHCFALKCMLNYLPLNGNFRDDCPWCPGSQETPVHAFLKCPQTADARKFLVQDLIVLLFNRFGISTKFLPHPWQLNTGEIHQRWGSYLTLGYSEELTARGFLPVSLEKWLKLQHVNPIQMGEVRAHWFAMLYTVWCTRCSFLHPNQKPPSP